MMNCPHCHRELDEEKDVTAYPPYQVICLCGMSGPRASDVEDAVELWNGAFTGGRAEIVKGYAPPLVSHFVIGKDGKIIKP